jgi:hypothetical protein
LIEIKRAFRLAADGTSAQAVTAVVRADVPSAAKRRWFFRTPAAVGATALSEQFPLSLLP